jgi:hypothetical protein
MADPLPALPRASRRALSGRRSTAGTGEQLDTVRERRRRDPYLRAPRPPSFSSSPDEEAYRSTLSRPLIRARTGSASQQCCSSTRLSGKAVRENTQHACGGAPQRRRARRPRDGRPACDRRDGRFWNPPLQGIQRARQEFSRQPPTKAALIGAMPDAVALVSWMRTKRSDITPTRLLSQQCGRLGYASGGASVALRGWLGRGLVRSASVQALIAKSA